MVWMISSAAWVALTGEVTQWVWPRLARAWAWASSRGDALIPWFWFLMGPKCFRMEQTYPLVNIYITMGHHHVIAGKINYFDWAMLQITRGYSNELFYWLVVSTPLKKKVSWDNCSQPNGKIKHIPNHQPVVLGIPRFRKPSSFHQINVLFTSGSCQNLQAMWPSTVDWGMPDVRSKTIKLKGNDYPLVI